MHRHRTVVERLCIVVSLVVTTGAAEAQSVTGTVREAGGKPVAAALVVLVSDGERVAGTISDHAGVYRIEAPGPGEYGVLVERIGYTTTALSAVVTAGNATHLDVTVSIEPTSLQGVTATVGSGRCRVRPDHAPEIQRVWDAARKALTAAEITRDLSLVRWRAVDHLREIDALTGDVRRDTQFVRPGWGTKAYVSAPPEELLRRGFVWTAGDTAQYFIPDASVLLSDWFLETRCFRLVAGEPGTIGLGFEPVRRRRVPDIAGVMWLDVATGHLLSLDFRYSNVRPFQGPVLVPGSYRSSTLGSTWIAPRLVRGRSALVAGGRVEFARLDGGEWFIRSWNLRIPSTLRYMQGAEVREVLSHIHEEGGTIAELYPVRGRRPDPR